MPFWSIAAPVIAGALSGLSGSRRSRQPTVTTVDKQWSKDPWGPSIGDLKYALAESRRIYDEPSEAKLAGPPGRDYSALWQYLGKGPGLPGGGGQPGGAAPATAGGAAGGARPAGPGAAKPPGAGDLALQNLYQMSLQDNPLIGEGGEFISRTLSPDLMPYFLDYISGGDIDPGGISERAAEAYGGRFGRLLEEQLGAVGDKADLSGMYGGSGRALEAASTKERINDLLAERILETMFTARGQNLGALSDAAGFQQAALGQIPEMEAARYIGPQAAAAARLEEKSIAMRRTVAKIAASAQRAAASMAASASRYGSDRAYAATIAGLGQRAKEWEFEQRMGLTDKSFEDDMRQWSYQAGLPDQMVDDYLRRVGEIAGAGGSGREWGTESAQGPKTSLLEGAAAGALGGWIAAEGWG